MSTIAGSNDTTTTAYNKEKPSSAIGPAFWSCRRKPRFKTVRAPEEHGQCKATQGRYGPCTAANTPTYPLGSSFHGDEGVARGGEVGNAESHHRQQHHAHCDARARAHRLQRRRGAGVDAVDVHRARSGPRAAARRWAHRHCRLIYPQAHRWQCTSLRNTSSGRRVAVLAHA